MNNIKKILDILGVKYKKIAEELGITPQALHILFKSNQPRKYKTRIANMLNIDEEFLSKNELTQRDMNAIVRQHHNITALVEREPEAIRKMDELIDLQSLLQIFNEWRYEDIEEIVVILKINRMSIPEIELPLAEVYIENNEISIISAKTDEMFSFKNDLVERVIKRERPNRSIFIIELQNGLTAQIIRLREEEERYADE